MVEMNNITTNANSSNLYMADPVYRICRQILGVAGLVCICIGGQQVCTSPQPENEQAALRRPFVTT